MERPRVRLAEAESVAGADHVDEPAEAGECELACGVVGAGVGEEPHGYAVRREPRQRHLGVGVRPQGRLEGRFVCREPRPRMALAELLPQPGRQGADPGAPHRGEGRLPAGVSAEEAVGIRAETLARQRDSRPIGGRPDHPARDRARLVHRRPGIDQRVVDVEQHRTHPRPGGQRSARHPAGSERVAQGDQAGQGRGLAEDRHRLEQRRRDLRARDGDADRPEGDARLLAQPVDDRLTQLGLDVLGIPGAGGDERDEMVVDVAEHVDGLVEHVFGVLAQSGAGVLGDLEHVVADEERPHERDGVLEQGDARLDQRGHVLQPAELPQAGIAGQDALALEIGQQARGEVAQLEVADVDTVEPLELLEVEDRPHRVDLLPREVPRELRERELLDVITLGVLSRRIGKQRKEIHERLRQVALLDEPRQPRRGVLALGDLGLVLVAQQRHVRELRGLQPEPAIEQQMLGRGGDPLLAADDVRHLHLVVVHDDREVVGREPVGLEDHLVVGPGRADLPPDQVVELQRHVVGDEHPHHGRLAETGQFAPLRLGLAVAEPVVSGGLLVLLLLLTHLLQPLGRAPAVVGLALPEQLLDIRLVCREALGLPVGPDRSADVGAFVPGQPQPVQGVEDLLLAVVAEAGAVGVLDPQDELAALLAREGEVEQGHIGGADVRVPRGRGGDAQPHRTEVFGAHSVLDSMYAAAMYAALWMPLRTQRPAMPHPRTHILAPKKGLS
ncbi:hypothetical protein BN11_100019 [Nostocoides australiense Ben110]|uniref:Uncharacterized protein n=1 Tax=Nostocoides australiense Ben110 TaxID=1193182 RepID=W6JZY0_9MICO|nr:hypothetical protein BN11_100019 [Tetrasphaera australiensis Ben110]